MAISEYGNGGVTFDILDHIGVIATYATGWRREINFISWNGAPGKYDIRDWDPSHSAMSKGMTFKENEMRLLLDLMRRRRRYDYSPQAVPNNNLGMAGSMVGDVPIMDDAKVAEADPAWEEPVTKEELEGEIAFDSDVVEEPRSQEAVCDSSESDESREIE